LKFNVSITSRELQTSRLGLVSAGEANVSVSSRSREVTDALALCSVIMKWQYGVSLTLPTWPTNIGDQSLISWPTFVLLSPALCLECDNRS